MLPWVPAPARRRDCRGRCDGAISALAVPRLRDGTASFVLLRSLRAQVVFNRRMKMKLRLVIAVTIAVMLAIPALATAR